MAVIKTPVSGRLRFTYPGKESDVSFSGIRPNMTVTHMTGLAAALKLLQTVEADQAFYTTESELKQQP